MPKEKSLFIEKLKFLKIKSFVRVLFKYQAERLMPAHKKRGPVCYHLSERSWILN